MHNVGCNVTYGDKHKSTLMLPWMWNLEILRVAHGASMNEKVKV
jgi:hypothetical protein